MIYSFHKYRISITTMQLDPLETFYEIYSLQQSKASPSANLISVGTCEGRRELINPHWPEVIPVGQST
jgi:hypothetical protein